MKTPKITKKDIENAWKPTITEDSLHKAKAMMARKERNKRIDDVANNAWTETELESQIPIDRFSYVGEYSKDKSFKKKMKKRAWNCFWVFVVVIIIAT